VDERRAEKDCAAEKGVQVLCNRGGKGGKTTARLRTARDGTAIKKTPLSARWFLPTKRRRRN